MNLDDLLAQAARLAADKRQTGTHVSDVRMTAPHGLPRGVRDLSQVIASARDIAKKSRDRHAADSRVRRQQEAYRKRLAERDQLFHRQGADTMVMDACSLRDDTVRGIPEYEMDRRCYLCGKDLPAFARRWCSNSHAVTWWNNHAWGEASKAALRRDDYTCRKCGVTKYVVVLGQKTLNVLTSTCRCGSPWVDGNCATVGDIGRPVAGHHAVTTYVDLEVNHIDPLVGKGYQNSCRHHLDGLETLCHPCHVGVTTQQRRDRESARLDEMAQGLGL